MNERIVAMVLLNTLTPPDTLLLYETLLSRKFLSPTEHQHYEQLHKGFIGEKNFKKNLSSYDSQNFKSLFGCLFEVDNMEFQIDCILLTTDTVYLLEVKNYTGDYYIEDNKIFNLQSKTQIYNPLSQIDRAELLFKRLLNEIQVNIDVRSYVVFVNPDFMMYGANVHFPMIYPTQIKRFLKKITSNNSPLTENIRHLSGILAGRRKLKSAHERIPSYEISQLKRGVFCKRCFAEIRRVNQYKLVCNECQKKYQVSEIILFSIAQYCLLFPKKRITTNNIANWCGNIFSKSVIRRVLTCYFRIHPNGSHTHYSFLNKTSHLGILLKDSDWMGI